MTYKKSNQKSKKTIFIATGIALIGLSGAAYALTSGHSSSNQNQSATTSASQNSSALTESSTATTSSSSTAKTVASSTSTEGATKVDLSNPVSSDGVTVSGSTVTITKAGTYELTGTLSQGQVVVNAADDSKVILVLNGVSISNTSDAAILVKQADLVKLETASGSENLVSSDTSSTDDTAAIFSHDDLTLTGSGKLTVTSAQNGVQSKDTLKVTGGTVNVTATKTGLKGKDEVNIKDGTITINAGTNGIKSTNTEEADRGNVTISGGTITINAKSQGIQAVGTASIEGGTTNIESSSEGIEATTVNMKSGKLTVKAQDDGLNGSGPNHVGNINVTGGTLDISCGLGGSGDAFDANDSSSTGNITITGAR